MRRLPTLLAAGAALLLAGCSDQSTGPRQAPRDTGAQTKLDPVFARASSEFNVPADLLKSVGYVETRWQMVSGRQEFAGQEAAFGIMALRGAAVDQGARLAGVSANDVRTLPEANIRAAAALLSQYATELGVNRADLAAWGPAVARYSGITSEEGQSAYVHNDVYGVLSRGAVVRTAGGDVVASIAARNGVRAARVPAPPRRVAGPDYAASIWRPSPNYNARPTGSIGQVGMVIIHDCEGSYSSCWSWLIDSAAQASAHYVVNESGSEISQLVRESDRAWHIAATYDCSLNSSVECWRNGYSSNHFTVGIEHGGFASQTSWPVGQIDASAKLSCDISQAYAIPRDRYHFVGHGQLQPSNRTDPGPNWPWTDYMNRINSYCGSTGGTSLIVDSNNSNNDTSKGYIQVSANWTSATSTPGYYGSGYYFANTAAISDGATFFFYLPANATKTIDAWWTAGTNRSASAPFIAYNAAGTQLGTVNANQQVNGGQWNTLGSFAFTAGWNKIVLSRWTTTGYVVIADAIRVR
ncbi:MAG TPA: N-acetylmuramoyl-L-alanine amidase [Longimicrobium sp.]|nr:N-acetylmuramoyl-L-alanine amidase [Longimicrobium sp.]